MVQELKDNKITLTIGACISIMVAIVSSAWNVQNYTNNLDKRLTIVEQKQERKAEKEDIKVLDVRLKSIETTLLEIKQDLQKK